MPAPDVLHQSVTAHDHSGGVVAFEAAHGTESGFESSVVAFDAVVRVPLSVVKRGWHEAFDRSPQRWGPVGHHLVGFTVGAECPGEEPACGPEIAAGRDEHVDDLAVLINRSIDVPPLAGNLHIRLVHIPTVADRMSARPGRIGEEWREALHPPVDGDVIDLDPTLTEQFFDIAIRESIPQIPAHGEDDDLGREPKTGEG